MENKKPSLFARLQNKITRSYGIALVVLLALMVVLSLTTDGNFLTYENIFNLSRATSVYGIVALAMTFVIITGGIDLSVGANVGLAGMLVTLLTVNHGFNMWLTMLIAVAACAMVGLLNGILNILILDAIFLQWVPTVTPPDFRVSLSGRPFMACMYPLVFSAHWAAFC